MKKVKVNFENCHGINNMIYTFDVEKNNYIIYATNGTMKTSFYKTIDDYVSNIESKDLFFPERKSNRNFFDENDIPINVDSIILVGNQDYNVENSKITSLLINNKLKKEYDEIFNNLNEKLEKIQKKIKAKTGEKEDSLLHDLKVDSIIKISDDFYKKEEIINFKDIKYSTIFNDDNLKIFSQKIIIDSVNDYIKLASKIIDEKGLFVRNIFELHNLKSIVKCLESNNYFEPGHLIKLKDNKKKDIFNEYDKEKMNNLILELDSEIQENPKVAAVNLALTNKISSQKLNYFLSENQWIIPFLTDIENLKKEYWHYIICSDEEIRDLILEYKNLYINKKETVDSIVKESNEEENLAKWNNATSIFNRKFINMPFKLNVGNLSDVILKNSACSLVYDFYEDSYNSKRVDEKILKENLSKGERNAFSILSLIFEIQYRIIEKKESLIIIDDIADSFDYKNKYAIIEFLKELSNNPLFHLIILTHNFDFYRSCSNRLKLKRLNAIKTNKIDLIDFYYTRNIFESFKQQISNEKYFLASIPFVRNLIELSDSNKNLNYLKLTSTLHFKKDTCNITTKDLNQIFNETINVASTIKEENYLDLLFRTADIFKLGNTEIQLENKLVLSIAIRIKLEIFLCSKINDWEFINKIVDNQTAKMIDHCMEKELLNSKEIELAEKVRVMTSDNIHVNAFMYEPIIDMTDDELIYLYNEVKTLK